MTQKKGNDPKYVAQVILSRRDHAEAEMCLKLKRKQFSAREIEDTIIWLKRENLINDEEFTRSYIENALSLKAVGPRWLRFKLQQKGLPQTLIAKILEETYSVEREKEIVRRAAEQWKSIHPKHRDDRVRLMRFLISRGFSSNSVSEL